MKASTQAYEKAAGFLDSVNNATDTPKPPEPGTFEHDLAVALADVRNTLTTTNAVKREPLFSDASALLTAEFPLATWAIVGLLTRMGVGIIGGEPKTAKTWTAVIMALAVATGSKAFGEFYAEAGRVAYFFAEDLGKQVRNKLRALLAGAGLELEPGRLHVCPRGKFLDITKDEDLAWVVASARKLGKIDLLVLDPLRDIHSAEEDKSGPMSDVMRRLRLLGELLGCTVLVVHHAGKANDTTVARRHGQRMRGSGAIHGSTDSGIYMTAMVSPTPGNLRAAIDIEIKGARGAGRFVLDVTIEDDENSEAVRATATVTRPAGKLVEVDSGKTVETTIDAAAFGFVRDLAIKGIHLTRSGYKNHEQRPPSVPAAKMIPTLDRLIARERLRLDQAGRVQLPAVGSEADS